MNKTNDFRGLITCNQITNLTSVAPEVLNPQLLTLPDGLLIGGGNWQVQLHKLRRQFTELKCNRSTLIDVSNIARWLQLGYQLTDLLIGNGQLGYARNLCKCQIKWLVQRQQSAQNSQVSAQISRAWLYYVNICRLNLEYTVCTTWLKYLLNPSLIAIKSNSVANLNYIPDRGFKRAVYSQQLRIYLICRQYSEIQQLLKTCGIELDGLMRLEAEVIVLANTQQIVQALSVCVHQAKQLNLYGYCILMLRMAEIMAGVAQSAAGDLIRKLLHHVHFYFNHYFCFDRVQFILILNFVLATLELGLHLGLHDGIYVLALWGSVLAAKYDLEIYKARFLILIYRLAPNYKLEQQVYNEMIQLYFATHNIWAKQVLLNAAPDLQCVEQKSADGIITLAEQLMQLYQTAG